MTIDMVDDWQQKFKAGHPYPLGVGDPKLLDTTFNAMHDKGKLEIYLIGGLENSHAGKVTMSPSRVHYTRMKSNYIYIV